jgi:hypothetical protein
MEILSRMRFTLRRVIILIALAAVCLWLALHVSEKLPDGWDAREFETAVRQLVAPEGRANVKIELLAWCTREDGRPHRYDSALAWARIEDQDQVRWALLELYRHPRDSAEWHLSIVSHSPIPVQYFHRQPSNSDIYRFVDGVSWGSLFKLPVSEFHTLNSRVRWGAWYRSVGEAPTRFFP